MLSSQLHATTEILPLAGLGRLAEHLPTAWIEEALAAREEGKSRTILFTLSGNGYLDLAAYDNYLAGKLVDAPCPQSELTEGLQCLPNV